MNKSNKAAQIPPSITLRLSRGRSVKITWQPRKRISSLLVKLLTKALAIFLPLSMSAAHALDVNALPTGGQVTAGSATINQAGNTLNINQASQKAALNWQNFNIGTNSTVNFVQPNSNAVALNRIGGNSASEIYGHLNANGQVFLMNPNGILFARGSQVNVGGIVATTMQLGDADFLAGNYNFNNAGAGSVANYGLINATNSVALLGSDVSNQGSIFATTASLVSGNTVALDVSTDGLIRARVVDVAMQANIANSGDINATQVTLSAGQAKDTLNRVVNNSGVIKATGFSSLNGEIVLQGGTTLNSGTLDATSATGNGGTVHMLGQHVGVVDSGSIDVSGATGGGTILVGGDYQGKNTNIENAEVTYVGAQATLRADATQNGNGGKVIVWADDTTRVYGSISAQGGVLGGDGGFVETSGHRYLDVNGARVNTLALHGLTGNWLLDPTDITISISADNNIGVSSGIFSASPLTVTTSNISAASINTQLANTNVTINTASSNNGGGIAGDITFDSTSGAILIGETNSSPVSLTLNAENDINFIGAGGTTFRALASTGQLDVNLNTPNGKVTIGASSSVTLDGSSSGPYGLTRIWLENGRTLHNHGILNITGNAAVHLGAASVFNNSSSGGVVNVAGSTGWAFFSDNITDNGIISNDGIFNVTASTAFEAAYNQTINGTLNIANTKSLNLQNAISLVGNNSADINLNATGILNINEYHGTVASLSNLTFAGGGGTLNVSGTVGGTPTVTFSGVNAPDVTLNIGVSTTAGNVTIAGNSFFKDVIRNSGTFAINNASLGIAGGSYNVFSGATYTGNVGYYAAGDLNITSNLTAPGTLTLMAGWNPASLLTTPTLISSGVTGDLNVSALVHASTGMTVTAGHDINLTSTSAPVQLLTDSGDQNITAGHNISLTASASSSGGGLYADIVHGTGTGNQTIDLINGDTLTLTGGSIGNRNYAQIDNNGTSGSIQKIWSSRGSGFYPTIVMNGGASGGAAPTGGIDNANIAEIDSDISQQIYANTITMTGGAGDYAGAIISAPTQLITTTGDVTLTGGSSNSTASGTGDTFTYKGVTYTVASPAAIGDKNNLSQTLTIGGTLTLNGGKGLSSGSTGTSRMAMVGSLNGLATGSVKANAIVLNSAFFGTSADYLSILGGVKDIVVTSTFANSGVTSGFISGNAWSIWAPNPTAITGCGAGTGCFADFAQYGVTFGSTPAPTILGTGHGWLYSAAAPALTATTSTNYSRVYDGTANAYLAATDFTVTGTNVGETAALTNITGNFANKNVGTAKAISSSAAAFSVTAASGIPVYGYATPTISGLTANITPSSIIAVSGITAANRVYDSTTLATLTTSGASFAGMFSGDNLSVASATGTFIDKNVATGKAVNITGITLGGSDLGNYILVNSTANTTANITPATLNWSVADATGNTGTIPVPGLATLSVIFGSDVVTGVVSAYDTNNVFAILSAAMPEGVYTEKVTGLTGTDAGNYSLASTGTTGVLTVNKSVITPEVEQEVTAVTSETISQPEDTQIKQEEDEIKAPEKVLVASNFVDDPKANNENPVETEKPKGRTLQCSVSK